jgi:hypothetical protein
MPKLLILKHVFYFSKVELKKPEYVYIPVSYAILIVFMVSCFLLH